MDLLNGVSLWDRIASLFDIIPKIIYYLYAALASGVDALQALVRKLAGLDMYWSATSGSSSVPVVGRDPLSEFVYGILGVGDSASVYKALNTVFWSLAIFGLIMLVVSTMIAIIKSHYNEDTAGTSPWKYIYTAVKAILTFVAIPVVVVIGMSLSTFALNTLDKIVAGSADEGAIEGIYTNDATTWLESKDVNGTKIYSHYDFFGAQEFTTSTPFSGMLFKASAYNANRARLNSDFALIITGQQDGAGPLTNSIFKNGDDVDDVAFQIDYAFANCLMYKKDSRPSYENWKNGLIKEVNIGILDLWKPVKINGFTKWNVSTVWMFYDLWQFNFIVGFTGVTASFGILISIVFGLLTRLIKGAALFLVFPALLGIAPMDNFKAFKSWGSQFMQQILMVFGAILGLNLLLLILPYIQNISFFDPSKATLGVLNAIMDVVILVVGLQMAKDFINIVNGFVGGADAVSAGDAAKEGTKKAIISGAKTAVGAGKIGAFGALAVGKGAVSLGKKAVNKIRRANNPNIGTDLQSQTNNLTGKKQQLETEQGKLQTANADLASAKERQSSAQKQINAYDDAGKVLSDLSAGGSARAKFIRQYRASYAEDTIGLSDNEVAGLAKARAENTRGSIDIALERAKLTQSGLDIGAAQARIATSEANIGTLKSGINTARETRSATIKKAESMGYEIVDGGNGGVAKSPLLGHGRREVGSYNEDGEMLDKNGKVTTDATKQGTSIQKGSGIIGGLQNAKDGTVGFAKNFGDILLKSVSWDNIGKNIADGFAKSFKAGTSALGLDKLTKDLQGVAGELKQTTFKAPDKTGLEGKEGDKLTKEIAKKQEDRDNAMQELLKKIADNTTPKSGSGK